MGEKGRTRSARPVNRANYRVLRTARSRECYSQKVVSIGERLINLDWRTLSLGLASDDIVRGMSERSERIG
jgi:hypothetical protein